MPTVTVQPPEQHEPEIQIIEFMGKNGGFATSDTKMWKVALIGIDGNSFQVSTHNHKLLSGAQSFANIWQGLTGFPIREYKEVTKTINELRPKLNSINKG